MAKREPGKPQAVKIDINLDAWAQSVWLKITAAVVLFLVVNLIANALSFLKLDLTDGQLYSLSDTTKQVLDEIHDEMTVSFYVSEELLKTAPSYIPFEERTRFLLQEISQYRSQIKFRHIRPEAFSEQEDEAVAANIRSVALNNQGDKGYFGIHAHLDSDRSRENSIAFLQIERENFLEYDIIKMLAELRHKNAPTIGLISDADPFGYAFAGSGRPPPVWAAIEQLQEFYNIESIFTAQDIFTVNPDMLLIAHLAVPDDEMLWGIEQYLLYGGRALIYADPVFESGAGLSALGTPANSTSGINRILNLWGLHIPDDKVVVDPEHGIRVNTARDGEVVPIVHSAWLRYKTEQIAQNDLATTKINLLNFATAGEIQIQDPGKVQLDPLVTSSKQSQLEDLTRLSGRTPDLEGVLRDFTPAEDGQGRILAARILGSFDSSFTKGRPESDEDDTDSDDDFEWPNSLKTSEQPFEVLLVSDVDMLQDHFWVRKERLLGQTLLLPFAGNGAMLANAVENLSGLPALSRLRSRGTRLRPFTLLEDIRQHAEQNYRVRANELSRKSKDLQDNIDRLQNDPEGDIEAEQAKQQELQEKLAELVQTRRELRDVRRNLNRDYELLNRALAILNIAVVPVLVMIAGVLVFRHRRKLRRRLKPTLKAALI